MNIKPSIIVTPAHLMAMAMMAVGMLTTTRSAGATALNGQLVLTPVTSHELTQYGIASSAELSGGLTTVGVGTAVYLEADVNLAVTDVTSVAWSVTNFVPSLYSLVPAPPGYNQTNLVSMLTTNSASVVLGTNVPIYEPSSQLTSRVAGRALFRPSFDGQYKVTLTITTTHEGTTNLSQILTAGVYLGDQICAECHGNNDAITPPDMWTWSPWSQTLHAQVFSNEIDADGPPIYAGGPGFAGETFVNQSCFQCHTTGYDANTNALVDEGFFDMEQKYGWTIPTVLTNGNYASMQANYPYVAGMANVQCESCHGPGSIHVFDTFGNTNSSFWPGVDLNYNSGDCNQCHDDATHHPYGTEWLNSEHAVVTTVPANKAQCVGCHTAYGFIARIDSITNGISAPTNIFSITTNNNLSYLPINCQTCHEPHGMTIPTNNPHMIRALVSITLENGTLVTNGGEGLLCMECHQTREVGANAASNNAGSIMADQADMLEGVNGYTYGQVIPSSDHASISNTCVTCHMQILSSSDPALLSAGGHTFNMSSTNGELMVAACQQCHGPITSFDFPVEDFDGGGVTNGVQTQVQSLLDQLAVLLPGGENNVINNKISTTNSWTAAELEAAYNYDFVQDDGSLGVHNTAYTVGLLQASIANLTGEPYTGPLTTNELAFYDWQVQWFGSATSPNAAYNAVNNSSGVPNWLMFELGLDPNANFQTASNGMIYINGGNIVNGATNTLAIYTAAEIVFNTQVNYTYEIQGISALSGSWQNISTNIPGTGTSVSYLTPTRNHQQMFFRVLANP